MWKTADKAEQSCARKRSIPFLVNFAEVKEKQLPDLVAYQHREA